MAGVAGELGIGDESQPPREEGEEEAVVAAGVCCSCCCRCSFSFEGWVLQFIHTPFTTFWSIFCKRSDLHILLWSLQILALRVLRQVANLLSANTLTEEVRVGLKFAWTKLLAETRARSRCRKRPPRCDWQEQLLEMN